MYVCHTRNNEQPHRKVIIRCPAHVARHDQSTARTMSTNRFSVLEVVEKDVEKDVENVENEKDGEEEDLNVPDWTEDELLIMEYERLQHERFMLSHEM